MSGSQQVAIGESPKVASLVEGPLPLSIPTEVSFKKSEQPADAEQSNIKDLQQKQNLAKWPIEFDKSKSQNSITSRSTSGSSTSSNSNTNLSQTTTTSTCANSHPQSNSNSKSNHSSGEESSGSRKSKGKGKKPNAKTQQPYSYNKPAPAVAVAPVGKSHYDVQPQYQYQAQAQGPASAAAAAWGSSAAQQQLQSLEVRSVIGVIKSYCRETGYGFINQVEGVTYDIRFVRNDLPGQIYHGKDLKGTTLRFNLVKINGRWNAKDMEDPNLPTFKSTIKVWNYEKNFGFIQKLEKVHHGIGPWWYLDYEQKCHDKYCEACGLANGEGKDMFVSSHNIIDFGMAESMGMQMKEQEVTFSIDHSGESGKPQAIHVKLTSLMLSGTGGGGAKGEPLNFKNVKGITNPELVLNRGSSSWQLMSQLTQQWHKGAGVASGCGSATGKGSGKGDQMNWFGKSSFQQQYQKQFSQTFVHPPQLQQVDPNMGFVLPQAQQQYAIQPVVQATLPPPQGQHQPAQKLQQEFQQISQNINPGPAKLINVKQQLQNLEPVNIITQANPNLNNAGPTTTATPSPSSQQIVNNQKQFALAQQEINNLKRPRSTSQNSNDSFISVDSIGIQTFVDNSMSNSSPPNKKQRQNLNRGSSQVIVDQNGYVDLAATANCQSQSCGDNQSQSQYNYKGNKGYQRQQSNLILNQNNSKSNYLPTVSPQNWQNLNQWSAITAVPNKQQSSTSTSSPIMSGGSSSTNNLNVNSPASSSIYWSFSSTNTTASGGASKSACSTSSFASVSNQYTVPATPLNNNTSTNGPKTGRSSSSSSLELCPSPLLNARLNLSIAQGQKQQLPSASPQQQHPNQQQQQDKTKGSFAVGTVSDYDQFGKFGFIELLSLPELDWDSESELHNHLAKLHRGHKLWFHVSDCVCKQIPPGTEVEFKIEVHSDSCSNSNASDAVTPIVSKLGKFQAKEVTQRPTQTQRQNQNQNQNDPFPLSTPSLPQLMQGLSSLQFSELLQLNLKITQLIAEKQIERCSHNYGNHHGGNC